MMDFLITLVNKPWFFIALAGVIALYFLALSTALAIWTARDVSKRTQNLFARIAVPVFVFVFGFAGFVPYLFLRPKKTFIEREEEERDRSLLEQTTITHRCPSCEHGVEVEFAHCPHCDVQFKPLCECGAALEIDWKRCAFCGASANQADKSRCKEPVQILGDAMPDITSRVHVAPKPKKEQKKIKANKDESKKGKVLILARLKNILAIKK